MQAQFEHFHAGEVAVHAEWGIDTEAYEQQSKQMMLPVINPQEHTLISGLTFSFAGTIDVAGRPWASPLLAGAEQLFTITSDTAMTIARQHGEGDPFQQNVADTNELSVLFFDTSTRRRAKSIGRGTLTESGEVLYEMTRLFGICPKYIFQREHTPATKVESTSPEHRERLDDADMAHLRRSDTIFFASHSEHGADVTHRGGAPGFVRVLDESTFEIPDYLGNGMFNTLGNLRLDDRLGVTTVDFETGRTLHITGRATTKATGLALPEPERSVTIKVEEVVVSWVPVGRWVDIGPSRYTPDVQPQ